MNELLDGILDAVQGVDPVLRTILAGIAILLETSVLVGLVVPGDTIVIVASTAIEDVWQYAALLVAVILGALAGESIGFAIGRWFGPRIRASRLGRRIGEPTWNRAEAYVARRGGIAVFLSRFLPVLHSLVPLTVGMSTMRYRRFLAWTAPACVLWAFGYATVGWAAADSYRELSRELHWAGYVFVGVIVVFLLLVWLGKKALLRIEHRHLDASHAAAGDPDASEAPASLVSEAANAERGGAASAPPRS
ncbi:DedA family protein [Agromyces seonyuensis]|uniref:DedA family protein n=1 Tax=Agromyces seonyuensis TaxID=2662446 RepID=A0A6I4P3C4_9MICO|nr:DedA family protein [Agromyces seonyuensis]MWB98679.1 DedA family protein [Agromyces seonyuensis]